MLKNNSPCAMPNQNLQIFIVILVITSPIYRTRSSMERAPPGKMRRFISRQTPIATQPRFALYPICISSFTYTNDCVITVRLERRSITGWCVSFLTDTYNSWLPRCLLLVTFSIQIAHDLFFILAKLTNILNRFKLMCSTTTRRR